ncbi:unnamed protein product [Amoebophrya sp. A120]|nr:unnamed protein product [Amoebophrya sp. A120]|eukprot:GSA120T00016489001.1
MPMGHGHPPNWCARTPRLFLFLAAGAAAAGFFRSAPAAASYDPLPAPPTIRIIGGPHGGELCYPPPPACRPNVGAAALFPPPQASTTARNVARPPEQGRGRSRAAPPGAVLALEAGVALFLVVTVFYVPWNEYVLDHPAAPPWPPPPDVNSCPAACSQFSDDVENAYDSRSCLLPEHHLFDVSPEVQNAACMRRGDLRMPQENTPREELYQKEPSCSDAATLFRDSSSMPASAFVAPPVVQQEDHSIEIERRASVSCNRDLRAVWSWGLQFTLGRELQKKKPRGGQQEGGPLPLQETIAVPDRLPAAAVQKAIVEAYTMTHTQMGDDVCFGGFNTAERLHLRGTEVEQENIVARLQGTDCGPVLYEEIGRAMTKLPAPPPGVGSADADGQHAGKKRPRAQNLGVVIYTLREMLRQRNADASVLLQKSTKRAWDKNLHWVDALLGSKNGFWQRAEVVSSVVGAERTTASTRGPSSTSGGTTRWGKISAPGSAGFSSTAKRNFYVLCRGMFIGDDDPVSYLRRNFFEWQSDTKRITRALFARDVPRVQFQLEDFWSTTVSRTVAEGVFARAGLADVLRPGLSVLWKILVPTGEDAEFVLQYPNAIGENDFYRPAAIPDRIGSTDNEGEILWPDRSVSTGEGGNFLSCDQGLRMWPGRTNNDMHRCGRRCTYLCDLVFVAV